MRRGRDNIGGGRVGGDENIDWIREVFVVKNRRSAHGLLITIMKKNATGHSQIALMLKEVPHNYLIQ